MIFLKYIFSSFLPSTYSGHLVWSLTCLGDACQSGKMATLLNSLLFLFKMLPLPNYLVINYDYNIVKWCSCMCSKFKISGGWEWLLMFD